METKELITIPTVNKISYSSKIPGYNYNIGGGPFWQSHLIGNEWMRCDFNKTMRVTGLKIQGSGQPGGRYWVKKFGIKYVGPDGNLRDFRNGQGIEGNNDAATAKPIKLMDTLPCNSLMIYPLEANNNTIAMKLWVTYFK